MAESASDRNKAANPAEWVDQHAEAMYRFALLRVRLPERAEELLQETFAAALRNPQSFSGRSAERTWLIGILKHKIADHYRQAGRERATQTLSDIDALESDTFAGNGLWRDGPKSWPDVDRALESDEFRGVLFNCLQNLPETMADAFTLREIEGISGEEVCKILHLTPTNLWTQLHRARMHLRRCLEINWFGTDKNR